MVRKVTQLKFEEWISVHEQEVLDLVAGGKTLRNAVMGVKQPYVSAHAYFHSTPERQARYEAARRAWVDLKNDELVERAEGVPAQLAEIKKVELQAEVIGSQSRAYHRERWGERLKVEREVAVVVDAGLVGYAGALLERMKVIQVRRALEAPLEVVVEKVEKDDAR